MDGQDAHEATQPGAKPVESDRQPCVALGVLKVSNSWEEVRNNVTIHGSPLKQFLAKSRVVRSEQPLPQGGSNLSIHINSTLLRRVFSV